MMRDLVTLAADMRLVRNAKLALIGRVGGKDAVLGIEHDHGLSVMLQIRHEGVDIRRLRQLVRQRDEGRDRDE